VFSEFEREKLRKMRSGIFIQGKIRILEDKKESRGWQEKFS
jgi:hypothetical protein